MTSDKRIVIGLVGRKGSGKGTVARLLKERYGASVYRFSDLLRETLDRLYVEKNRENLVALSEILRHQFGEGVLKQAMVRRVGDDPSRLIVIDGIRRLDDLNGLEELGTFYLINIAAPVELRHERVAQRGENAGETTRTFDAFKEMEMLPTEVTIGDVEPKARKTIENLGSYDELAAKVDELMSEIKNT
ncbi:MAG: AAA family ATPase [Patescibacteria group bacterium]|jgi:dephospho-CoA kinase